MDLMQVLSDLPSTSSGTGNSYYTTRCPEKVRLDPLYPSIGSVNARVGTVAHKLLHLYYTRSLNDVVLPVSDMAISEDDPRFIVNEGLRLFSGYTAFFPPDEFDILGSEMEFKDIPALEDFWGVPFSFRPDLVVSVRDDEHAAKLQETRRIQVTPGAYLMDHKTHGQRDSNIVRKWQRSTQFVAYIASWNHLVAQGLLDMPLLQGTIVNDMVRHKDLTKLEGDMPRSFMSYYVQPPSDYKIEQVRAYYQFKAEYFKSGALELAACDDWNGCPHGSSGACSRF